MARRSERSSQPVHETLEHGKGEAKKQSACACKQHSSLAKQSEEAVSLCMKHSSMARRSERSS
eukprot:14079079-Alexandrium_andersonii.AAC.1